MRRSWRNHVDADLDTAEKVAGYTKRHYEVFEFGFWAVEEKKSGNLAGVVGFRIPQDDAARGCGLLCLVPGR